MVQEQLGHSDLSMTLRYTKVLPELAEAAARRGEDILAGVDETALSDEASGGGPAAHQLTGQAGAVNRVADEVVERHPAERVARLGHAALR